MYVPKTPIHTDELSPTFNSPIRSKLDEDEQKSERFISIIRENKPHKERNATRVDIFLQNKLAISIADVKDKYTNPTLKSVVDFVVANYCKSENIKKLKDHIEHMRTDRAKGLNENKLFHNLNKLQKEVEELKAKLKPIKQHNTAYITKIGNQIKSIYSSKIGVFCRNTKSIMINFLINFFNSLSQKIKNSFKCVSSQCSVVVPLKDISYYSTELLKIPQKDAIPTVEL